VLIITIHINGNEKPEILNEKELIEFYAGDEAKAQSKIKTSALSTEQIADFILDKVGLAEILRYVRLFSRPLFRLTIILRISHLELSNGRETCAMI